MIPASPVPAILAARMARIDREIAATLEDAGAVSAPAAIAMTDDRRLQRQRLQRLVAAGAVRVTDGRYYLDAPAWAVYQARRRTRVMLVLAMVIVLTGAGIALGIFTR